MMALITHLNILDRKIFYVNIQNLTTHIIRSLGFILHPLIYGESSNINTPSQPKHVPEVKNIKDSYFKKLFGGNYLIPMAWTPGIVISSFDEKAQNPLTIMRMYLCVLGRMVMWPLPNETTGPYMEFKLEREIKHLDQSQAIEIYKALLQFHTVIETHLRTKIISNLINQLSRDPNYFSYPITHIMQNMQDCVDKYIELFYGLMVPASISLLYGTQTTLIFNWRYLFEKCIYLVQRSVEFERQNGVPESQGYTLAQTHLTKIWAQSQREDIAKLISHLEHQYDQITINEATNLLELMTQPNIKTSLVNHATMLQNEVKTFRGQLHSPPLNASLEQYRNKYIFATLEISGMKGNHSPNKPNLNKASPGKQYKHPSIIDVTPGNSSLNMYPANTGAVNNPGVAAPMYYTAQPQNFVSNQTPIPSAQQYYQQTPQMYGPQIPAGTPYYTTYPIQQQQQGVSGNNMLAPPNYVTSQANPAAYSNLNTIPMQSGGAQMPLVMGSQPMMMGPPQNQGVQMPINYQQPQQQPGAYNQTFLRTAM